MRVIGLIGALALFASSQAHAQASTQTAPDDARVADAWMLHLEDELDARVSMDTYFGAPLAFAESVGLGLVSVLLADESPIPAALLAGASAMAATGGIAYYATPDPERATLVAGGFLGGALVLMDAAYVVREPRCTEQLDGSCIRTAWDRDVQTSVAIVGSFGLLISTWMLSQILFAPPPRVADLRLGFQALSPADKTARLLSHLRTRERFRQRSAMYLTAISAASTAAFTYGAIAAQSDDGRVFSGSFAGAFGAITIGAIIWMLVETPDSERLLAGELPDE